jgi:hypothetical protein
MICIDGSTSRYSPWSRGRDWRMKGKEDLLGQLYLSVESWSNESNSPFFSQHALNTLRTDFLSNNRPISSLKPFTAASFENGSGSAKRGSTLACEIRSPSGWNRLADVEVISDSMIGMIRNKGSTGTCRSILPPDCQLPERDHGRESEDILSISEFPMNHVRRWEQLILTTSSMLWVLSDNEYGRYSCGCPVRG